MRIEIAATEQDCIRWVARHVRADIRRLPACVQATLPKRLVAGVNHPQVREVLSRHPHLPRFEAFVIDRAEGAGDTVVVASHHVRGVMFGLLEISRRLGIDPLGYFTDVSPRPPAETRLSYPILSEPPAFKYRGFFINEEDLLAAWKGPGPIPMEVFDRIFLTILRLRGNMVLPGTYVAPDSPILDLAAQRGLVAAQHHFQVVGTDVGRLSAGRRRKYSFVRFPEETTETWRRAIRANKHRETVWTLGYRGMNDEPFWYGESRRFSDRQKGAIISRAVRTQLRLLREELGTSNFPCVYYLYRENQILFQEGYVRIPKTVTIVWCDNGYGAMESYFRGGYELWGMEEGSPAPREGDFRPAWPEKPGAAGGLYLHVAFYDSAAPNRVQYVSPRRLRDIFTQAQHLGVEEFLLLNVGNMREFVLGIAAAFDFACAPRGRAVPRDQAFLRQWCAYYFGRRFALEAARAYDLLYKAHWWWDASPGKCVGDNAVRWLVHDSVLRAWRCEASSWVAETHMPGMTPVERAQAIAREAGASLRRWRKAVGAAEKLEKRLRGDGRRFFRDNVVTQARRGLAGVQVVVESFRAAEAIARGDARCYSVALGEAQKALTRWEDALSASDHAPKWAQWSKGDQIVRPGIVRDYLKTMQSLKAVALVHHQGITDLHTLLKKATACVGYKEE